MLSSPSTTRTTSILQDLILGMDDGSTSSSGGPSTFTSTRRRGGGIIKIDSLMLDFDYVAQCKDVQICKEILRILTSGKEGYYPDLVKAVETKILELLPTPKRNKILSLVSSSSTSSSASASNTNMDVNVMKETNELNEWIASMTIPKTNTPVSHVASHEKVVGGEERPRQSSFSLPPVRTASTVNSTKGVIVEANSNSNSNSNKHNINRNPDLPTGTTTRRICATTSSNSLRKATTTHHEQTEFQKVKVKAKKIVNKKNLDRISKERLSNRDYFRAWDKFDVDAAEAAVDQDDNGDGDGDDNGKDEVEEIYFTTPPSHNGSKPLIVELQKENVKLHDDDHDNEMDKIKSNLQLASLSEVEKKFLAKRERDKGNECFQSRDYMQSITHYTHAIVLLTDMNVRSGIAANAEEVSQSRSQERVERELSIAYSNRAMSYMKLSQWGKGIEDCSRAIDADDTFVKPLVRRGMIHHQMGNYDDACRDLMRGVELEPHNEYYCKLLSKSEQKRSLGEVAAESKWVKISIVDEEEDADENEDDRDSSTSKHQSDILSGVNDVNVTIQAESGAQVKRIMIVEDDDDDDSTHGERSCGSSEDEDSIEEIYTPGARMHD